MSDYQAVPKRNIRLLEETEENTELKRKIIALELCRESDDELWKQLVLLQLEELKMLRGKEGRKIKNEIRRKLQYGL